MLEVIHQSTLFIFDLAEVATPGEKLSVTVEAPPFKPDGPAPTSLVGTLVELVTLKATASLKKLDAETRNKALAVVARDLKSWRSGNRPAGS